MDFQLSELNDLLKDIPVGAWVAVSERQHKVMAYGIDHQSVLSEAEMKGEDLPLMVRVQDPQIAMCL